MVGAAAVAVAEHDVVVVGALVLAAHGAEHVGLVHLAVGVERSRRDADVAAGLVDHAQAVPDAQLRQGRERGREPEARPAAPPAGGTRLGLQDAPPRGSQLRLGPQLLAAARAGCAAQRLPTRTADSRCTVASPLRAPAPRLRRLCDAQETTAACNAQPVRSVREARAACGAEACAGKLNRRAMSGLGRTWLRATHPAHMRLAVQPRCGT